MPLEFFSLPVHVPRTGTRDSHGHRALPHSGALLRMLAWLWTVMRAAVQQMH
jgi:hypothetical protein